MLRYYAMAKLATCFVATAPISTPLDSTIKVGSVSAKCNSDKAKPVQNTDVVTAEPNINGSG